MSQFIHDFEMYPSKVGICHCQCGRCKKCSKWIPALIAVESAIVVSSFSQAYLLPTATTTTAKCVAVRVAAFSCCIFMLLLLLLLSLWMFFSAAVRYTLSITWERKCMSKKSKVFLFVFLLFGCSDSNAIRKIQLWFRITTTGN